MTIAGRQRALGAWGACPVCGKETTPWNRDGRCYLCQRANRSTKTCSCGNLLSARSRTGLCRACFGARVRDALASPKQLGD